MILQFHISRTTKQLLAGTGTKSTRNIITDISFDTSDPVLPTDPANSTRYTFVSDFLTTSEFDVWIRNSDGSGNIQLTEPR
jgi:hypothetical protein